MTLTGTTFGRSQAELIENAKLVARAYFAVQCVVVQLSNEVLEDFERLTGDDQVQAAEMTFTASFEAIESHRLEARSYGPAICRDCKQESWPQNPLPNGLLS